MDLDSITRGGNSLTRPERFPDFFLIGAPRCGTTSLSSYLANNPQVCFSRPKEPHYFSLFAPRASLAEDVTKLSNLLQRDLRHWLTEP
jgi:Sulfotransferase family